MPDVATPHSTSPRVVVSGTHAGSWQFQAVELASVVAAVGDRLFAASMKCFVGVDRLMVFEQRLVFNAKQLKEELPAVQRRYLWRAPRVRDPIGPNDQARKPH